MNSNRRDFVRIGLWGTFIGWISSIQAGDYFTNLNPTPSEIKGPFYPITPQKDKDFDLTQIEGKSGRAKGTHIIIEGKVLDTNGSPVEDASVELWQANAAGRYSHPHDPNKAELDPNFQGWAIVPSGKDGGFRFKTVIPGSYPASQDWMRPPHIHYKVSKLGYVELITQMYFPGHQLNQKDLLLNRKIGEEQGLMIAKQIKTDPQTFHYEIVLEKA